MWYTYHDLQTGNGSILTAQKCKEEKKYDDDDDKTETKIQDVMSLA